VFIRSLATRGHLGGLSRSTFDVAHVLDAMGYTRVLIETVGVGQDEVEVMRAAHTTVVVTVPGLGDDIQAIKAGLLEVADVLVVNKADREGADRTERDLMHMLDLRTVDRKDVEIVRTIATRGTADGSGIKELAEAVEKHRERAWAGEGAHARANARAMAQLAELVRAQLADRASKAMAQRGGLTEIAQSVVERRADPWTIAEELVATL
jgi:LAO/AO transport system kinase